MDAPEIPWSRAVLALGANLGDRDETLFRAVSDLRATEGIRVVAESSIHETVALTETGYDDSVPGYLNQVVLIDTAWQPLRLLEIVLSLEASHGRTRDATRYASRTLDIDVISYDDLRIDSDALVLPHPRAHERQFVLAPWLEVDPDANIPGRGRVDGLLGTLRGGRG